MIQGSPNYPNHIHSKIMHRLCRKALKESSMEVIGGPRPTAVAILDRKMPAVRFMVLAGFPDMTVVGATMKSSKKVKQLKKNPDAALLVWSGKEFSSQKVLSIKKSDRILFIDIRVLLRPVVSFPVDAWFCIAGRHGAGFLEVPVKISKRIKIFREIFHTKKRNRKRIFLKRFF